MNSLYHPFPARKSRIGFHYFPDTLHYRESDLQAWLPELADMGVSWLVLKSDIDRAIPEAFIRGLLLKGIEPVIQFDFSLGSLQAGLASLASQGFWSVQDRKLDSFVRSLFGSATFVAHYSRRTS